MANQNLGNKLLKNQVVRFVFSAGVGFLVDVSAFYLFYHNLLVQKTYHIVYFTVRNYTLSFSISFFLGVLVNFLITRYFVFSESKLPPYKQFFRFVSVAFIGYFANLAVLKLFIQSFQMNPIIARPSAALSLFFLSFFVHKFFSFSLSLRHH
ncbi:GtrA family protein, partial [uncultured Mucilaginibacter sp.]|uniref:GtrA family protein n=1 Tax=uncultured Mucilaginibacter sp. TaxID=797541 RepID=UPI0025D1C002